MNFRGFIHIGHWFAQGAALSPGRAIAAWVASVTAGRVTSEPGKLAILILALNELKERRWGDGAGGHGGTGLRFRRRAHESRGSKFVSAMPSIGAPLLDAVYSRSSGSWVVLSPISDLKRAMSSRHCVVAA